MTTPPTLPEPGCGIASSYAIVQNCVRRRTWPINGLFYGVDDMRSKRLGAGGRGVALALSVTGQAGETFRFVSDVESWVTRLLHLGLKRLPRVLLAAQGHYS
jgi:hypothetical protein